MNGVRKRQTSRCLRRAPGAAAGGGGVSGQPFRCRRRPLVLPGAATAREDQAGRVRGSAVPDPAAPAQPCCPGRGDPTARLAHGPGFRLVSRHAGAEQVLTSRAVPPGSARKSAARRRRPCSATSATRWMTPPVGQAPGAASWCGHGVFATTWSRSQPSQLTSIIPDQPRATWTLNPQASPFQVEVIELPL